MVSPHLRRLQDRKSGAALCGGLRGPSRAASSVGSPRPHELIMLRLACRHPKPSGNPNSVRHTQSWNASTPPPMLLAVASKNNTVRRGMTETSLFEYSRTGGMLRLIKSQTETLNADGTKKKYGPYVRCYTPDHSFVLRTEVDKTSYSISAIEVGEA